MTPAVRMRTARLECRAVTPEDLEVFHSLVIDEHVRRYLMDGRTHSREWSAERIRESSDLFARRGVGLWLVTEVASGEVAGFTGFLEIPSLHPEPQLVYAMRARFRGRGYATEMAGAMIDDARRAGFGDVLAGVDEANAASLRVLEKLGFRRVSEHDGVFGRGFLLVLEHKR